MLPEHVQEELRGIRRHGRLRTFLTRGLPGKLLRPWLYDRSEQVHYDFLHGLNQMVGRGLPRVPGQEIRPLLYWFVIVAPRWFELLFMPSRTTPAPFDSAGRSDQGTGDECAVITQAYCLWVLEQFLKNDDGWAHDFGIGIQDVPEILHQIHPHAAEVIRLWEGYRFRFQVEQVVTDPRDWPIIYLWDVHDVLVSSHTGFSEAMRKWNESLVSRLAFVQLSAEFFVSHKQRTPLVK